MSELKKIISLFKWNYHGDRLVRDEVTEGAEWVVAGEGRATIKWDGTCCLVRDRKIFKRYDLKKGKTPPAGFEAAQDPDPVTSNQPGWVPVGDGPEDRWFREALANEGEVRDGTYELVGPKIQGNLYRLHHHRLYTHGGEELPGAPRTFDGLKAWLPDWGIEGIVWHHPDGRMVKIKRRDFGLPWPPKESPS